MSSLKAKSESCDPRGVGMAYSHHSGLLTSWVSPMRVTSGRAGLTLLLASQKLSLEEVLWRLVWAVVRMETLLCGLVQSVGRAGAVQV